MCSRCWSELEFINSYRQIFWAVCVSSGRSVKFTVHEQLVQEGANDNFILERVVAE